MSRTPTAVVLVTWEWSPGGLLTLAVAFALIALTAVAWRIRDGREPMWLGLVILATAFWALTYSLELSATTASARQMWGDVKYVWIGALAPAWMLFVSSYTGNGRWLRGRLLLLLAVEPVTVLVLLANRATHDLIRYYPTTGPHVHVAKAGALFWPHSIYTYLLMWGATAVLVVRLSRMSPIYRRQSTVLVLSLTVPFVLNVLFNLDVAPFDRVDLTPFGFLFADLVLVWGVLRMGLVGLRPIGRSHVVSTMSTLVVTLDPRGRIADANDAAAEAFGAPAERLIGRPLQAYLRAAGRLLARPDPTPEEETLGGRVYELQVTTMSDRRGRVLGRVLAGYDVTGRKDVEARLSHQALHDPLTGIANRTLYFDRLSHALDHAARTHKQVGVLFLDIDEFKAVNDRLGHAAGDAVLVEMARRLQSSVRKDDTVARMGGDEFAVLLEDLGEADEAVHVVGQILAGLRTPFEVSGQRLSVSASVGVATGLDESADALVRRADESMYAVKRKRAIDVTDDLPQQRTRPRQPRRH